MGGFDYSILQCAANVTDGSLQTDVKIVTAGGQVTLLWRQNGSSTYQFHIQQGSSANASLRVITNGAFLELAVANVAIPQNAWFTMKLVVSGFSLQGYINGALVLSATDPNATYNSGGAGVEVDDPANTGNEALFDNVIINENSLAWYLVNVTDTLPTGLTYLSSTGGGSASGQVVSFNLGTLTAQAQGSLAILARVDACAVPLVNTAAMSVGLPAQNFSLERRDGDGLLRLGRRRLLPALLAAAPTSTVTRTPTATDSATSSMTPSRTPTDSATPSSSPSATASDTPTATPSQTATAASSASLTATDSATSSATPTTSPTVSDTATSTDSPSLTASPSVSSTPTQTIIASDTCTATITATATMSPSPTDSSTATSTVTSSASPTVTPSFSSSATPSSSPSSTDTATSTPSLTVSATPSLTPSASASFTHQLHQHPEPHLQRQPHGQPQPPAHAFQVTVSIYNSAGELVRHLYAGSFSSNDLGVHLNQGAMQAGQNGTAS